jgi:hypothetical protein
MLLLFYQGVSASAETPKGGKARDLRQAPREKQKRATAEDFAAVIAEIEGRFDKADTKESVAEVKAELAQAVEAVEQVVEPYNLDALTAFADAERLRGLIAARELIMQAALNAALRVEAERLALIAVEEADMVFVAMMLSEA